MTQNDEGDPADKVRQGEIILKHRTSRIIVVAALAGGILLMGLTGFIAA